MLSHKATLSLYSSPKSGLTACSQGGKAKKCVTVDVDFHSHAHSVTAALQAAVQQQEAA